MLALIERFGRTGTMIIITLLSVIFTQVITHTIYYAAGMQMSAIGQLASFLSPLLIAPVWSWSFIGLLIKIKNLEKEMTELARFDSLTKLYNRSSCFTAIDYHLAQVKSAKTRLVILFIDIDHFKLVNDTYGHDIGDWVLRDFAAFLAANLRENDVIGRIGGEEFLVSLPGLSPENGRKVAEKLCKGMVSHPFNQDDRFDLHLTISIGMTSYHHTRDLNLDDMIKDADIALYHAKRDGRNQVCCYPEPA